MGSTRQIALNILRALEFAAEKHRDQRRKGVEASPYINHPIQVAEVLATVGQVEDLTTLMAALLHDTIEDTDSGKVTAAAGKIRPAVATPLYLGP